MTARTETHRFRNLTHTSTVFLVLLLAVPLLASMVFFLRPLFLIAVPLLLVGIAFVPSLRRWAEGETAPASMAGLRFPPGTLLGKQHSWVRHLDGGELLVGADDLTQRAFGPVAEVRLPEFGRQVRRGELLFELRSPGRRLAVRSPLSGRVVAVNDLLRSRPGQVNVLPYDTGWVAKIVPDDPEEASELKRGNEARHWLRRELDRLTSFLSPQLLPTSAMADGGELAEDLHRLIDGPTWELVRHEVFGDTRRLEPEDN